MRIVNDPIDLVMQVINNLYPDLKVNIQFNPNIKYKKIGLLHFGKCGMTTFPDDGGTPLIDISANIPFYAVPEILAHEIAHVVVGKEHGHDLEWEDTFDLIHDEYDILTLEKSILSIKNSSIKPHKTV